MPRVYVVNYIGHDISPVNAVVPDAEIVHLSEGNVNIFATDRTLHDFKLKMLGSATDDYLLLSGSIALNIVAFGIMLQKHGRVNLLLWHARMGQYMPRTITTEDVSSRG